MLSVRLLSKKYGDFSALRDVDLTVRAGSVHALLGHNGAGKSTLIGLLGGAMAPSGGVIELDGVERTFSRPRESMDAGISIIHQHQSLIESLSVSDNVFLGEELTSRGRLLGREQDKEVQEVLRVVGATCAPRDRVSKLDSEQRQLVEIAKALRRKARVLILDEPTAALSDSESRRLAAVLDSLRADGMAIIYVTHLLGEVERLADDVTVLEDGEVSFSGPAAGLSRQDLVALISGSHGVGSEAVHRPQADREIQLEVSGLQGEGFGPVDLQIGRGEIVGLFGMLGSGRSELLETLAGARRATGGTATGTSGQPASRSVTAALQSGICLVPGDRQRQSIFHGRSVQENALGSCFGRLAAAGWRRRRSEASMLEAIREDVNLRAPHSVLIGSLSGGNQQKVVLGRALKAAPSPQVVLLDGPTQGVDVKSRSDIYASLRTMADAGVSVLFSSTDPEEMVTLADRIVVVRAGQIVAEVQAADASESHIIHIASSVDADAPSAGSTSS